MSFDRDPNRSWIHCIYTVIQCWYSLFSLCRATISTAKTIVPTPVQNWLQALLFYWTTLCRIIWLCVPYSSRRPADKDFEIGPLLLRSATCSRRGRWRYWRVDFFRQLHNIRVKISRKSARLRESEQSGNDITQQSNI